MPTVEQRVTDLAGDIFDAADLAAFAMTPKLVARSASFTVLAHAEMEHAIEEACRSTARLLQNATEPASALIIWGIIAIKDSRENLHKSRLPSADLVSIYEGVLDSNQGIREHNLRSMLIPIGVDLASNRTDILALDEFGNRRGLLAHNPLSHWKTTDLPSVHRNMGIQAARSADQIVAAILNKHSQIDPRPFSSGLIRRFRKQLGKNLHSLARRIGKA
ncbi:MAG TPA: hypothetical protein DEP46_04070 [Blastocatellia bacterium]|nr:hypothetical protein [Blastocatellia bacterium]